MTGSILRLSYHYIPKSLVVLALVEAAILMISVLCGIEIYVAFSSNSSFQLPDYIFYKALLFSCVMLIAMVAIGLYCENKESISGVLYRIFLGFLLGMLPLVLIFYLFPFLSIEIEIFLTIAGVGFIGIVVVRGFYHLLSGQDALKQRTLVLGAGERAHQLERSDHPGIKFVGYIPVDGQQSNLDNGRLLPKDSSLYKIAKDHQIKEIVVALDDRRKGLSMEELLECKMNGVKIVDFVHFFESRTGKIKINEINPSIIIFSDGFKKSLLSTCSKRFFDIAVSTLLLVFLSPVILLIALAIFLESRGRDPILYQQIRVGKDNLAFKVLKFRTMYVDAEADGKAQWAQKEDPRVTKVGKVLRKFRLDELPQLINVIKGEMSFVGPRPERPEFVKHLSEKIPYYHLRHTVKPGITGWAQVSYPYGSNEEDAAEKLQYDLYYIKNHCLLLDVDILFQTVHIVLWGRGQ